MKRRKIMRVTLEDAVWQSIKSWTSIINDRAKKLGLKEYICEEQVIAAFLTIAAIDSDNERHELFAEQIGAAIGPEGIPRSLWPETTRTPVDVQVSGTGAGTEIEGPIRGAVGIRSKKTIRRHVEQYRKVRARNRGAGKQTPGQ